MRCSRNVKLFAIYALAVFNLIILLYTQFLHPVDKTNVEAIRNKKLSFDSNVKPYSPLLLSNLSSKVTNSREQPFDRFNLLGNIINNYQVFPQFNLLLNPSRKCQNVSRQDFADVFLLVLVTSSVRNFRQRKAVRDTWGSLQSVNKHEVLTLFMLGVNDAAHHKYMNQVRDEYEKYGDIIMENFNDTYLNLTLKTIMGFKWTVTNCPTAKYVMKTDDDMFINLNFTVEYLAKQPPNTKKFVRGHVINGSPIRNEKSKWFMSYHIYPYDDYPPFASGTCYIMSTDVVRDTYQISLRLRYLHLEDVFSALCWERLGIVPRDHPGFNIKRIKYSYCRYKNLISVHNIKIYQMYDLWNDFNRDMAKVARYFCLFNGWFF